MQVNRIAIARDLPSFDVAVEQRLDARGKSSVIVVHAGLTPEARAGSSHGRSGKSTIQSLCPFSGLCFWEFLAGRCAWMRYSACLIATNNSSIDGQPMDDDNDLKHSAVDKALVLLKLLGDFASHGEVRLVDVVKASGYQRPTVHRLLATLKNHGFFEQDQEGGTYRLCCKIMVLGAQPYWTAHFLAISRPFLLVLL